MAGVRNLRFTQSALEALESVRAVSSETRWSTELFAGGSSLPRARDRGLRVHLGHVVLSAVEPRVGVGAICVRDGRLLVVQRGHAPGVGLWSIPGGHLETGETLAAAVAREVLEETGLEVTVGPLVGIAERFSPIGHYVILDFAVTAPPGAEPVAGDDATAVAWVTRSELCTPSTASAASTSSWQSTESSSGSSPNAAPAMGMRRYARGRARPSSQDQGQRSRAKGAAKGTLGGGWRLAPLERRAGCGPVRTCLGRSVVVASRNVPRSMQAGWRHVSGRRDRLAVVVGVTGAPGGWVALRPPPQNRCSPRLRRANGLVPELDRVGQTWVLIQPASLGTVSAACSRRSWWPAPGRTQSSWSTVRREAIGAGVGDGEDAVLRRHREQRGHTLRRDVGLVGGFQQQGREAVEVVAPHRLVVPAHAARRARVVGEVGLRHEQRRRDAHGAAGALVQAARQPCRDGQQGLLPRALQHRPHVAQVQHVVARDRADTPVLQRRVEGQRAPQRGADQPRPGARSAPAQPRPRRPRRPSRGGR